MKAAVKIEKSFDGSSQFRKGWESGDFREFFKDEGEYLDKLCGIMEDNAKTGEEFTVTYTVTVVK